MWIVTVGERRPFEKQRREAGRGECVKDLAKTLAGELVEQGRFRRHLRESIVHLARLPLPGACKIEGVIDEWSNVMAPRLGDELIVDDPVPWFTGAGENRRQRACGHIVADDVTIARPSSLVGQRRTEISGR